MSSSDDRLPSLSPSGTGGGAVRGIAAAALFGASTPVAKLLVPGTGPLILAGLLYVGAGVGLFVGGALRRSGVEAPIRSSDLPILALVVLSGAWSAPCSSCWGSLGSRGHRRPSS